MLRSNHGISKKEPNKESNIVNKNQKNIFYSNFKEEHHLSSLPKILSSEETSFLEKAEKTIKLHGIKILKNNDFCSKIVSLGHKSAEMLLNLMSFTDKKLESHIPSTAVGLARKIVKKEISQNESNAIEFFAKAFGENKAFDHVFHVIKDCKHPIVFDKMSKIFSEYSSINASKASFMELSYLRYSVLYLAENGTIDDAIKISKLLDNPSNQIRVIAGVNLINFSLRKDINEGSKSKLAESIFQSISKNSIYYAAKLEVLEKGDFDLDSILSNNELFNKNVLGSHIYYSTFNRFLSRSPHLQQEIITLLSSNSEKKIKIGVDILFNNLRKHHHFNFAFYNTCVEKLSKISMDESVSLDVRKKIALVFSFFPSFLIIPWTTQIYTKSKSNPDNEFFKYVYELPRNLEIEKKHYSTMNFLLVSTDTVFRGLFASELNVYLSSKGLNNVRIREVDSSLEAIHFLFNLQNVKVCFIEISPNITKPENQFLGILNAINNLNSPPLVIFFYNRELDSKTKEWIYAKFPNLNITFHQKNTALTDANSIFKSLALSRDLKSEKIFVSKDIFDHLNNPLIKNIIQQHYGEFIDPSKKEPFGKKVLILERGNQAHIQLKEENTNPRIRFLLLTGAAQSSLLNRYGIKKAMVEHLGGFNLGSKKVSVATNSIVVYYDKNKRAPSGKIIQMKWKNKSSLSKGDIVQFVYENGKGSYSCFLNKSARPVLLKLIEYI